MVKTRTAKIKVCNQTNDRMMGISLQHKYSNEFRHQKQWESLGVGETTTDVLEVQYNTGFLTTGTDWWFISWFSSDGSKLLYSNPNNFRDVIDKIEKMAPSAVTAAAGTIAVTVGGGLGAATGAESIVILAENVTQSLFNSESTKGFKMHTLRGEDENQVTTITIRGDRTILFSSPSGKSETVYTSKNAN